MQVLMSTMCGGCGDNQLIVVYGSRTGFTPHNNRKTGEPCPGDHEYRTNIDEMIEVPVLFGDASR